MCGTPNMEAAIMSAETRQMRWRGLAKMAMLKYGGAFIEVREVKPGQFKAVFLGATDIPRVARGVRA
jgi:hypothetical protein